MEEKREGALEKHFHLPQQPIEWELVLGIYIPKERDAPRDDPHIPNFT